MSSPLWFFFSLLSFSRLEVASTQRCWCCCYRLVPCSSYSQESLCSALLHIFFFIFASFVLLLLFLWTASALRVCLISLFVSSMTQCFFAFVIFMWVYHCIVEYTHTHTERHARTRIMLSYFTPLLNKSVWETIVHIAAVPTTHTKYSTFDRHAVACIVVCAMCKDQNDGAFYHP